MYIAVMITPKANYGLGHTQQLEKIVLFSEKDDKWIEESSHVPLGECVCLEEKVFVRMTAVLSLSPTF